MTQPPVLEAPTLEISWLGLVASGGLVLRDREVEPVGRPGEVL